jgi:aminoglycoside phosphotransferase (APT) family kinase protein
LLQPWTAEFEVSPALAEQLIAAQFPELRPVRAEPFGLGWDNVALRINEKYVFRFPRRALGARCLEAEVRVMPAIAPMLPLATPDHRFVGRPTPEFQWPFVGYEMIRGQSVCHAKLSQQQREDLAEPLARFLKALHHIPADSAKRPGVTTDPLGRFDMPRRIAQSKERLSYIAAHGLVENVDALVAIVDSAPRDYKPRHDVLVHGDLYARHLLVDERGKLSGVIDWGDIHLGDPATDLAVALTVLPPSARSNFQSFYGTIDQLTWTMATFRAVNHTSAVLYYAHETRDDELLREMQLAMHHITS